jgi:hypothetical protein
MFHIGDVYYWTCNLKREYKYFQKDVRITCQKENNTSVICPLSLKDHETYEERERPCPLCERNENHSTYPYYKHAMGGGRILEWKSVTNDQRGCGK